LGQIEKFFFFSILALTLCVKPLGQIEIFFPISALTPSVKPLELISTFAPIGMLDLGSTLALTPSVKGALLLLCFSVMKFLAGLCDFYWLRFSVGLSPTEIHGVLH
jgi:hypothetical protein